MSALADITSLGSGFRDPAVASQQVFRSVLDALSRPGRVQQVPPTAWEGVEAPGLPPALATVLLSLLDAETTVWLAPGCAPAASYLKFHTGVKLARTAGEAQFVVSTAEEACAPMWSSLALGTDEVPQAGATWIIEVPSLAEDGALRLSGPGIERTQAFHAAGLDEAFWRERQSLQPAFPRGVDLVLCSGRSLAAIPRSTRIALEA